MKLFKSIILSTILMAMSWVIMPSVYAESTIVPFYNKQTGQEPWVTDLTPEGTKLLKDLSKGRVSSFGFDGAESDVISLFGYQYFLADSSLYRSDTTAKRTGIENNLEDFLFTHLVKYKNKLFYTLRDTPTIYRVHPRGDENGIAASTVVTYDQSKSHREILAIKANVYDDKMILLIENQPRNSDWTYDLRLSNGQTGWSKILNYQYQPSHLFTKKLSKIYVTDRFIYFLAGAPFDNEIWMTPNTTKMPKTVVLKPFKLPKGQKLNYQAILADKHLLYFATQQGDIYKTDGSQKRTKRINRVKLPNWRIERFISLFKNHLIYKTSKYKNNSFLEELYKINLETGKITKLAITSRDRVLPG